MTTAAVRPYRQRPEPINMAALDKIEELRNTARLVGPQDVRVSGRGATEFCEFLRALDANAEILIQAVREVETLRAKISRTAAKSTRRSKQLRQQNKTIEVLNGRNRSLAQEVYDTEQKLSAAESQIKQAEEEIAHLKREVQKHRTAARQFMVPVQGSGRFA